MCHNISQKKSLEKITGGPCLALCRRRHSIIHGCCCGCSCAQQAMVASQSCIMRRPPNCSPLTLQPLFGILLQQHPPKRPSLDEARYDSIISQAVQKVCEPPSQWPPHHHFSKKTNSFLGYFQHLRGCPLSGTISCPPLAGRCAVWITGCGVKTQKTQNRSIRGLLRYKMQAPPTLQQGT
jgi:hypothetical protein